MTTLYNRGSARRSLVDTVAFRACSQVATAASYVLLVRGLSEADFGVLSLLYTFVPVVGTVASLGLEQVLRRYQPEYLKAGNNAGAAWLVRIIARSRFVTNVVVLSVILLAWDYVAPLVDLTAHRSEFMAFCLLILLYFQTSVMSLALGSHMLHRYSVGSAAVLAVVKLVLYGALLLFHALALETAIAADTVAYAAAYLSMRVAYRTRCLPEAGIDYKPEPAERTRLLRYGMLNNFNDAGVLLMYSTLDRFLLAGFIGTTAVGIYAFYSRLSNMVTSMLPVRLFDNVVRPLFFAVPAAEAERKIPVYFTFLLNTSLLVQWPALAFSVAYHTEVVEAVFGGKFIEDAWLMPVIVAFGMINAVSQPSTLVAQYEERAGIILASKLFVIYNVIAMFALVPFLGVFGAALAAGTAQTMKNYFVWWYVRGRARWLNGRRALPIGLALWGTATAVCLVLKAVVSAPAIVQIVIGAAVFGLAGLVYVRSSAFSAADRAILAAATPDRVQPLLRQIGLLPAEKAQPAS